MTDSIATDVDDYLLRNRLKRPPKRNALDRATLDGPRERGVHRCAAEARCNSKILLEVWQGCEWRLR
jgi:hypothetical protein